MEFRMETILLVDDDLDDCRFFEEALKSLNKNVRLVCLHNCDDLSEKVSQIKPQLIVFDLVLPKKTGVECLAELSASSSYNGTPMIMYTGASMDPVIEKAYEEGAILVYQKPLTYNSLVQAIDNLLHLNWLNPQQIYKRYRGQLADIGSSVLRD